MDSLSLYQNQQKAVNEASVEEPEKKFMLSTGLNNMSLGVIGNGLCVADEGLKLIYENYSPYLYPFTVEFNILVGKYLKHPHR